MSHRSTDLLPAATAAGPNGPFSVAAQLACLKGEDVLFCPARQAVFGLNQCASDIWRAVESGLTAAEVEQEMTAGGLDPEALVHVRAALTDLERQGLIRRRPDAADASACIRRSVEVAGVRAQISYPLAHALPAAATLRHLEIDGGAADIRLELVDRGDRIDLYRDGGWIAACPPDGIAPALRAQLLSAVLERDHYALALHAASLVRGDRALLVCGASGAGKTTLSLALADIGFGFAGDDVALLDRDGRSTGIPFAPAVKRGGWRILKRRREAVADLPAFSRPDGVHVRYPVPERVERASAREVGWIVLLDRGADGPVRLEPVGAIEALRQLLAGAFAPEQELTAPAFEALVHALDGAEIRRLSFCRAEDAAAVLDGWCG